MSTIQPNIEQPVSEEMALVRRAKRGDDQAFEELVRRYDRNVFRIAQHITQNREDAEDVVQEAFLKAYKNLEKFQEQSKFYTWLVRIAVNEALMKLRRRKPGRTVSLDEEVKTEDDSLPREVADWSPNPEQMYNQAELRDILTRTIQGLPSGFRTVFVLRDVEGLSTEETAQALELSIPAVKSRLLRARLQLRDIAIQRGSVGENEMRFEQAICFTLAKPQRTIRSFAVRFVRRAAGLVVEGAPIELRHLPGLR